MTVHRQAEEKNGTTQKSAALGATDFSTLISTVQRVQPAVSALFKSVAHIWQGGRESRVAAAANIDIEVPRARINVYHVANIEVEVK